MKKSYLFPNFVLPLFGALAVMCAGSCSQEILEVSEDLVPDNLQTRAGIAQIGIVSNPAGKGIGNEYYGKDIDYTFNLVTSGVDAGIEVISTNVSVFTTIDGGIDQISRTDKSLKLRFTKCGVYQILATRNYRDLANPSGPIMLQQATITCRVASPVASIEGPSSVALGKVYNFSVNFEDPDYPDPNLEITEAIFNDPQCTIINNDGAGNYLIRFDQPGAYAIKPGLTWTNSSDVMKVGPHYCVEVFFRPEMMELYHPQYGNVYGNWLVLYDAQKNRYTSLPFRVYFKYRLVGLFPTLEGAEPPFVPDISGEVRKEAGSDDVIVLPDTDPSMSIKGFYYADSSLSPLKMRGYYWEIEIPRDRCYSLEEAGGIVIPGKPIE
ncbi:hypothetical protein [Alistipes finegoldii]|jgi:hypothetical protein|uniref:hypothetical protein n=1 Tax=Alistipes finegoldii TaxID=214856 RepID=UPI003AF0A51C